jgi:hypothetical protein
MCYLGGKDVMLRLLICAVLSAGLGLALFEMPYAYYELLRIAVCAGLVFLAFAEGQSRRQLGWVWGLGLLAVLFNPLVPIHLGREAWAIVDAFAAVIVLFYGWSLFRDEEGRQALQQWLAAASHDRRERSARREVERQGVAKTQRNAAAQWQAARREERLKAVVALALECGAKGEPPDTDEIAIVLSEYAFGHLRAQYARANMPDTAAADLRDALVILIVTDAVSQQLNVQWETLSMGMHAGWMLRHEKLEGDDRQLERIAGIFGQSIDLQASLASLNVSQHFVTSIGRHVTKWMCGGGEKELYYALEPIRRLRPDIVKHALASASLQPNG